MKAFYDTSQGEFKSNSPQRTKRELVRDFFEWIVTTRNDLDRRAMRLRREVREGVLIASFSPEIGEAHGKVCLRLAQIEADLAVFETMYLVAAEQETDEVVNFAEPSTRLLWEWFIQAQEDEDE